MPSLPLLATFAWQWHDGSGRSITPRAEERSLGMSGRALHARPCSDEPDQGEEAMDKPEKIEVRNVISPGHVTRVDAAKYGAMKKAMMDVLPDAPPGMTPAQIKQAILPALPPELFPEGDKAGWWIKCVQLDLEARNVLKRLEKPVRLYRA
jgi:hypothetical protein